MEETRLKETKKSRQKNAKIKKKKENINYKQKTISILLSSCSLVAACSLLSYFFWKPLRSCSSLFQNVRKMLSEKRWMIKYGKVADSPVANRNYFFDSSFWNFFLVFFPLHFRPLALFLSFFISSYWSILPIFLTCSFLFHFPSSFLFIIIVWLLSCAIYVSFSVVVFYFCLPFLGFCFRMSPFSCLLCA